jgi:predicted nucleic acid-binding protein
VAWRRFFKDTGEILAKVLQQRPDLKSKLPALVNDCLLALTARSLGATLYSRNRDDFSLLQSIRTFSLVVIS